MQLKVVMTLLLFAGVGFGVPICCRANPEKKMWYLLYYTVLSAVWLWIVWGTNALLG